MKYCKNCGNPVADGENFCRKCGTKQEDSFGCSFDTNTVASPYYDDVQPIQISKTLQIIIKILLIVAITIVLIDAGRLLVDPSFSSPWLSLHASQPLPGCCSSPL